MEDKIITCRKDHVCCACGATITKRQKARFESRKVATYGNDDNDGQTGIWYHKIYLHDYVCINENGETITRDGSLYKTSDNGDSTAT